MSNQIGFMFNQIAFMSNQIDFISNQIAFMFGGIAKVSHEAQRKFLQIQQQPEQSWKCYGFDDYLKFFSLL